MNDKSYNGNMNSQSKIYSRSVNPSNKQKQNHSPKYVVYVDIHLQTTQIYYFLFSTN